ncbi:uncharacterized protein LOC111335909 [Stylophora pistillata]|uniref:Uncharacterized protein n=1 Tax=Stylophora pistillata TaxID=50429 RepID=A0A2B4RY73_STYPI|nr:uncharacterized protein LOC111335909 [Stylophora pistillata]XP_022797638.1 uncharacterized protein LOC111335909 [Stylophora pistillata]XP_022797639.1 uncharacterized protein LOC111335909 [Stylophora pistillata]XP_022797640.1 uncharacterized protein LOC111335909 [Stylophora pistillata]PFX21195.1 hypothetical protein AWC38_SpisGene14323 [Stylophora pistillata]
MIVMSSCVKSSTPRTRRSLVGPAAVGVVQIGIPASHQVLDDWCMNLTKHLNTTLEKFGSITFNTSMASSVISSSGITVLQRLTFDLQHLEIYYLLFGQISSSISDQKFNLCVNNGINLMGGLVIGMQLTELYLNGTSPFPPQFVNGGAIGGQTRYQDLSQEIAQLKSYMRRLAIILASKDLTSVQV